MLLPSLHVSFKRKWHSKQRDEGRGKQHLSTNCRRLTCNYFGVQLFLFAVVHKCQHDTDNSLAFRVTGAVFVRCHFNFTIKAHYKKVFLYTKQVFTVFVTNPSSVVRCYQLIPATKQCNRKTIWLAKAQYILENP